MNVFSVIGVARSGVGFMCRAWFGDDGSLTLVSNDGPGWRSAHRQVAESRGLRTRATDDQYISTDGVAMRRTRWTRKA